MLSSCFLSFMNKKEVRKLLKKVWYFIWEDNSIWSWIVNIILAFVLIKFIVYPGLGFLLTTSHPVVAVVSESMEHNMQFDNWWKLNKNWYIENGIDKEEFKAFSLKNGFNKGDIMVLVGRDAENIEVGDVIVFNSNGKDPIIHRVVKKMEDDEIYFQTKGDNNKDSIKNSKLDETNVRGDIIIRLKTLKAIVLFVPTLFIVSYGLLDAVK